MTLTTTTGEATGFADFGLAEPLTYALEKTGFSTPTPIQANSIAPQMEGSDLLGIAQTGTGKTAAFVLPMLHEIYAMDGRAAPKTCRALVLVPTRELAVQINDHVRSLAGGVRVSSLLVLGGTSRQAQIRGLERGVDILIATPGRLTDLMQERRVRFDETKIFVLDEADRMLDMGFIKPVQQIAKGLHPRRRTALFSATMPKEVEHLAAGLLRDPVRVEVTPPGETATKVAQTVELLEHSEKRARLAEILNTPEATCTIVFTRTKRGADRVMQNLGKDGIEAEAIHGMKSQNARQRALDAFRKGRIKVLVATDIAARGIDVKEISHVVQYDLPDEPEAYVHRIGRTGRNGAEGVAIALCSPEERDKLKAVEKVTRSRLLPEGAPEHISTKAPRRRPNKAGAPNRTKPQGKPGGTQRAAHENGEKAPGANRRRRRPRRKAA
ncbi:DEAD/DEAH box helicase [Rhodobacteraceae bacterium NNCM2]|nr:DEAD/DEAH box helicase [Coraliihabitans acroporae]